MSYFNNTDHNVFIFRGSFFLSLSFTSLDGDTGCPDDTCCPLQSRQVAMELLSEGCLFRPGVSPAGIMQWAVLEEVFVGHQGHMSVWPTFVFRNMWAFIRLWPVLSLNRRTWLKVDSHFE